MLTEINTLPVKEIAKGINARFIHTNSFTLGFINVEAGAILPEHAHMHEQTSHIIEGEFELTIGNKTKVFKPGMVAIIPSNIVHSGRALTDCTIHDVFSPVREDYK